VQTWEAALVSIIKQEMLHLALSINILTAVGAAPHFERPNFPILSRWYPSGVQIALVPFGERALRHFIYLERPEGMPLIDAEGFSAARHASPLTVDDHPLGGAPQDWRTVGHLYRGIGERAATGRNHTSAPSSESSRTCSPPRRLTRRSTRPGRSSLPSSGCLLT
jgi:hypothetical protein